jgi:two-component system nitrate/nitrite response regulator NarL
MARPGSQMHAHPPKVVLADDHPLVRLSVREDLERGGFQVCAEVATGAEAIEAAVREQPDLCVLDISMPGGGGLHAAAQINLRVPSTKVVMLTATSDEENVLEAVRAGACGYLLKDDAPDRLAAALRDVLDGIPSFPRRLMPPLVLAARNALGPPRSSEIP